MSKRYTLLAYGQNPSTREGTAALPYAEISVFGADKFNDIPLNRFRVVSSLHLQSGCSERNDPPELRPPCRGGLPRPPDVTRLGIRCEKRDPIGQEIRIEQTSQRAAWWDVEHKCRETKVFSLRSGDASVYRRLRHACEAPTTQANLYINLQYADISQLRPKRAGTEACPYAEILPRSHMPVNPIGTNLSTRRVVECRAGGPLAGLSTDQILQVSTHSAAIRAGTIHDGQFHHGKSIPKAGMVDPLSQRTAPPSLAEPAGYRISRNIRRPRHIRDTSTTQAH